MRLPKPGLFTVIAVIVLALGMARPAKAGNNADELVRAATNTLSSFMNDPDLVAFQNMVRQARGVLVIPSLVKGGFIFGAEGGSAVLLGHRGTDWSYPAFFTVINGSFGLQIGVEVSEVVLVIRTDGGLRAILSNNFHMGVDASIAIGPIGRGVDAATTTNLNADIVAFLKTQGLFGGGALKGGVITGNQERNELFYGQPLTGTQIVTEGHGFNPKADALRQVIR